jgi:NAD(P)-dependent dehydrogenase (short-subunit alcohol dehydrogenase family)
VDISDEAWQEIFDINVMSGVRLSRALVPGMVERQWGRIIFISSESGVQIPAEMVHYGPTKTAQLALSRGIAESVAGTGVTSNAVLPGPTRSEGVVEFVEKLAED